jgi:nicotinamidase/pyrazinamidase
MSPIMTIDADDVLLVIDIQNDFLPGGALPVAGSDAIAPLVNRLIRCFAQVVVTQDWHPEGHSSFASTYEGAKPFDVVKTPHGEQTLWPDHCVQGAPGAALHEALDVDAAFLILRKGVNAKVDSYSAFTEADGKTTTGLAPLLKARGARRLFACGLATDYCVAYSALDARAAGFETFVVDDACRAVDAGGSLEAAWAKMNAAQVWRIQAREILG